MMDIICSVLSSVLLGVYQPCWFALITAVLFMFFYLYSTDQESAGQGTKEAFKTWIVHFKTSKLFRKLFLLAFYTGLILFRTLFNRNMWLNPLTDVMGNWWIYDVDPKTGEMILTTECLENFILFIPFSFLVMSCKYKYKSRKAILYISTKIVLLISLSIEFLQLFLRVGTFQISDLFYNTLGGLVGGFVYIIYSKFNKLESV